jgi:membrane protease YdiL (CAAX protease family)
MNEHSQPHRNWLDACSLLFALLFPSALTWVYFVALAGHAAGVQQLSYSVGKAIQFLFPVVWVFARSGRSKRWEWPVPRGIAAGIGFGVLVVSSMLLLYRAYLEPAGFFDGPGEEVRRKVAGMGIDSPGRYLALGVFYSLGHSFLEEYYWRWFVFGRLRDWMAAVPANLVSSLGFMAHHVIVLAIFFGLWSPATWIFSGSVAAGGAFWAWLYHRSGSMLGPWFSHLLVDAGIFWIGYDLVKETI